MIMASIAQMKYKKAVTMLNPENERIRAQAILRSLTDYQEAVELFNPTHSQAKTVEPAAHASRSRSILRIFKTRKHRPAVQQPAYSPQPVVVPGCSD
jgi:hypothetical protein